MRYLVGAMCFFLIGSISLVNGQRAATPKSKQYAVVPSEIMLIAIVSQPDCPIQLEDVKHLYSIDGEEALAYSAINKGAKPIRAFTMGTAFNTWGWTGKASGKLLMPSQRLSDVNEDNAEIVPLTDELRDKLNLRGPPRKLEVVMVLRIEYADGSTYDAMKTYDAMRGLIEDVTDILDAAKAQSQKSQ